jgi:hypothetical protein
MNDGDLMIKPLAVVHRGIAFNRSADWGVLNIREGRFVYVIGPPGAAWCKVGITRNMAQRLRAFMCESGTDSMALWDMTRSPRAGIVERLVHRLLRPHRIMGERFAVHPNVAIRCVRDFIERGDDLP